MNIFANIYAMTFKDLFPSAVLETAVISYFHGWFLAAISYFHGWFLAVISYFHGRRSHPTITCCKTPTTVTWSEPLKSCCHVNVTESSPIAEQVARKFRNRYLQAKERTWVNCKLITAWHQNKEPDYCVVWVSYC